MEVGAGSSWDHLHFCHIYWHILRLPELSILAFKRKSFSKNVPSSHRKAGGNRERWICTPVLLGLRGPVCFSTQLPLAYPRPHPCPLQPSATPQHCPPFLPSFPCCCCHCSFQWFQRLHFTCTVWTAHSNCCNQENTQKSPAESIRHHKLKFNLW